MIDRTAYSIILSPNKVELLLCLVSYKLDHTVEGIDTPKNIDLLKQLKGDCKELLRLFKQELS